MKPAEAQFAVVPGPSRLLWITAAAALVCAMFSWAWALVQRHEVAEARRLTLHTQEARAAGAAGLRGPVAAPPYGASAHEFLRQRALPWPEALTALESVALAEVWVRSIEFQANDETIRVEVFAPSHARVIEYVEALNAGGDERSADLRWSLLQSQADPSGPRVTALLAARRPASGRPKADR